MRGSDHRLVRTIGRLPVRVRTKLLVAFVGTVVLLVVVGVLGLRVLGQSNSRVERLGDLQVRATAYRAIQAGVAEGRDLLGLRAGGTDVISYAGGTPQARPTGQSLVSLDQQIRGAFAQVGLAASADGLGFVPPPSDEAILAQVLSESSRLLGLMQQLIAADQSAGSPGGDATLQAQAEASATRLRDLSTELVNRTQADTDALIAQNRSSFHASERLFVGAAVGSIVLALVLGLLLSWSVVDPIRRIETRVEAIASGDFSTHVDVTNRDELGALAANINRMNDELGRLYQELETVSRHKSEFLANMSHELRTPLNAIIGFSEVLHEQMFGELNEQQLGYVGDVLDAGKHLLSLINDILDLSKVEAGRMELELGDVWVSQALRDGLTMQGERASRGRIALDLHVEPEDLVIQADERKVRQVMFNLLSNAVKFTPPGGVIDVSAEITDGVVEVAVRDTGSGIALEDQELIFEEFQQARGAGAGKHPEGTGLGLPLSRKFVELHGGRLWVESAPGAGSTFRFTLPLRQESGRAP